MESPSVQARWGRGPDRPNYQSIIELQALFDGSDTATRIAILDKFLQVCGAGELQFLQKVVSRRTPLSSDPVAALGRQNSLSIFAFLDPRSLARCAQVSWAWHDVAVLDVIWRPKCLLRGWPIPYTPSRFESGAWRSWYVQCVKKVEAMAAEAKAVAENSIEGAIAAIREARAAEARAYRSLEADDADVASSEDDESIDSDYSLAPEHRLLRRHTRECELRLLKLLQQHGLEQHSSALLQRDRSGGAEDRHRRSTARTHDPPSSGRLGAQRRQAEVSRALEAIEAVMRQRVTEARQSQREEKVLKSMNTPRPPTEHKRVDDLPGAAREPLTILDAFDIQQSAELSETAGAGARVDSDGLPDMLADDRHPRLILVSSECRARVLLVNAVRFDVASLPYDAKITTAEVLLRRIANLLRGRTARSIAVVCPGEPGRFSLGTDMLVSLRGLVSAEGKSEDDFSPSMSPITFWTKLAAHVLSREKGGGIHIFAGQVQDCVSGVELFEALRQITGLEVTCPLAPLGQKCHQAWCRSSLSLGVGNPQTRLYFTDTGLCAWLDAEASFDALVDDVQRAFFVALRHTRTSVSLNLVGELTENVLFSKSWINAAPHLRVDLEDAIESMLHESPECPSEYVGDFLKQRHNLRYQDHREKENDEEAAADDLWLPIDKLQKQELVIATSLTRTMTDFHALVRTEEDFVEQFRAIRVVFAEPLRASMASVRPGMGDRRMSKRPMTTIEYRKIFTDPLALLKVHEQLLEALHSVEKSDVNRSGVMCLAEVAREERVYKNYVAGIGTSLHAIAECCKQSPVFRAFATRSREHCGGRSLMDLVQLPLTRLPYYIQAIEREIASGNPSSATAVRLEQIQSVLKAFTVHINNWKQRAALQIHCERAIGPIPLPKNSQPVHPRNFVCEGHFVQVEQHIPETSHATGAASQTSSLQPIYKAVQDVVLLLFQKELIILTELGYFDSIKQDVKLDRTFQARLPLVEFHISVADGSDDLPFLLHVQPLHGGPGRSSLFFASRRRAPQLEFYEAVKSLETMDVLEKKLETENYHQ